MGAGRGVALGVGVGDGLGVGEGVGDGVGVGLGVGVGVGLGVGVGEGVGCAVGRGVALAGLGEPRAPAGTVGVATATGGPASPSPSRLPNQNMAMAPRNSIASTASGSLRRWVKRRCRMTLPGTVPLRG